MRKKIWILIFGFCLFSLELIAGQQKKEVIINGIKCEKDGTIIFYKSGKLKSCSLSETCEIQRIKCAKGGLVEFYESGKLKSASLLNNQKIQGVLCSKRGVVKFFPSGKLQAAILARDTIINGIKYKKGEWIWFFDSDNLIVSDGIIKEEQEIGNLFFSINFVTALFAANFVASKILILSMTFAETFEICHFIFFSFLNKSKR